MLFKGAVAAVIGLLFVYGFPSAKQHVMSMGSKPVAHVSSQSLKSHDSSVDKLTVLAVPNTGENEHGEILYRASVAVEVGIPIEDVIDGVKLVKEFRTGVYNCDAGLMSVETVILLDSAGQVAGSFDDLNKVLIAADNKTIKGELDIVCKAAPLLNNKNMTYI